jgi:nicotinic acid mononucleotide adenylyltransferase
MTTPTDHLSEILTNLQTNKLLAVLVGTGSYNPVHVGHIEIFKLAKEKLKDKFEIIGGFISPSHESYVSSKYLSSSDYIPIDDRLKMIELATKEAGVDEWLKADPWYEIKKLKSKGRCTRWFC